MLGGENIKRVNLIILSVRILLGLTFLGALLIGVVLSLSRNEFLAKYFITALTALLSIGITHIPDFITHKDIMAMPIMLQTAITIFTFLAMFLGEIFHFYYLFFWWDIMLHFSSGIIFSMIGFMFFVSLNRDSDIRIHLNPLSVLLFSIFFAIACGAIWEIFESTGDSLLGMNMQHWQSDLSSEQWEAMKNTTNLSNPGLIDTMKDLTNDTIGALLSIFIIYPLIKRDNKFVKSDITSQQLLEKDLNYMK